jgi:hypothetical protein
VDCDLTTGTFSSATSENERGIDAIFYAETRWENQGQLSHGHRIAMRVAFASRDETKTKTAVTR